MRHLEDLIGLLSDTDESGSFREILQSHGAHIRTRRTNTTKNVQAGAANWTTVRHDDMLALRGTILMIHTHTHTHLSDIGEI